MALLRLVASVRRDVRIVVNELLLHINQLNNLLFPVDVMGGETKKADIYRIKQALYNDEAVIIFPAGEVSRAGAKAFATEIGCLGLSSLPNPPDRQFCRSISRPEILRYFMRFHGSASPVHVDVAA